MVRIWNGCAGRSTGFQPVSCATRHGLKTRATAVTVVLCALVAMARAETFEAEDHPLATNGAQGELAELLEQYRHPPQRFSYTMELIDEQPLHRMYKLTYPSPFESPWPENNVVPAEFYLPRKATGKIRRENFRNVISHSLSKYSSENNQ